MIPPKKEHREHESSHTNEAIAHAHHPYKEYGLVWAILMVLLLVTVGAAHLNTHEPWSFLIALTIAVIKAVLVILFFMHVKDASRVTWVFCGCSFLWLGIMLVLTFGDYITRSSTPNRLAPEPEASSTRTHLVTEVH
jgi:cytochrome c oxidase subunit 4